MLQPWNCFPFNMKDHSVPLSIDVCMALNHLINPFPLLKMSGPGYTFH